MIDLSLIEMTTKLPILRLLSTFEHSVLHKCFYASKAFLNCMKS